MLKPQISNTCNTFFPDISSNGNAVVLMKSFYHRALNVVQIVVIRHKPFRFPGISLSFNSCSIFFFQDDKDIFVLDISPRIFEKRQKQGEGVGQSVGIK